MLVLARKPQQKIVIGDDIVIQILRKNRDVVKIGIEAPISVPVHRQEVYDEIQRSNHAAVRRGGRKLPLPPKPSAQSALATEPLGPVSTKTT